MTHHEREDRASHKVLTVVDSECSLAALVQPGGGHLGQGGGSQAGQGGKRARERESGITQEVRRSEKQKQERRMAGDQKEGSWRAIWNKGQGRSSVGRLNFTAILT